MIDDTTIMLAKELVLDWLMTWGDVLWIPVLMIAARKGQRIGAALFVCSCMFMMRLMIDLMVDVGYPNGVLQLWSASLFVRGLWTYSAIYVFYAGLHYFFAGTKGVFLLASAISLFFTAMVIFAGIMVL